MSGIVLADYQGQAWLVCGERYIDELLANTLPGDISIEFIACGSHADVNELWLQNRDEPAPSCAPWVINPAIVNRVRYGPSGHSVYFTPWSALLDDAAKSVIRAAAVRAARCFASNVTLASHAEPETPRMIGGLAELRCGMIESELTALGIAPSRIVRANGTITGVQAGLRIDIVINGN
jgi:hypothetical protein